MTILLKYEGCCFRAASSHHNNYLKIKLKIYIRFDIRFEFVQAKVVLLWTIFHFHAVKNTVISILF